ncbi:MAG: ferredoxin [Synechococcales cyanobacterium RM1_1_8]|nr:ferredoxin [Synechococcales cyanobacterium RM1_1_8]
MAESTPLASDNSNRVPGSGPSQPSAASSPSNSLPQRSSLEPELGGVLRGGSDRTGLEPELGSSLRQRGVYVDEVTCIGCRHCAHVARNTFFIEPDYGRARVMRQDGDGEALIQEAIDTCPVDCISWLDYAELRAVEESRKDQIIPTAGFPVEKGMLAARQRRRSVERQRRGS